MNQGFQVMKLSHNFGRRSFSSWLILNINDMTGGTSGVGTASSFVASEANGYQSCQFEATTPEDWKDPLLCTTDINNVIIFHRNVQVRSVRRTVIRHVNVRLQPPKSGKIHYFVQLI
jgi:hypothetical protein